MSVESRASARGVRHAAALCLMVVFPGCAAARLPTLPATATKHPDFVFPAVPPELQGTPAAERFERGWRYLQNDNLPMAALEFRAALARAPGFVSAQTGQAYVALAQRDYARALTGFDAALTGPGTYVPALVGRGQSLLALKREVDALEAFERALTADSSLADLRRRVEVLRFRTLQDGIEAASVAAAAGRLDEARAAYRHALDASPDSAFLHRELGAVERRRGEAAAALEHFERASELDASDVVSLVAIGELLDARGDFAAAESAYRRAAAHEPSAELTARIAKAAGAARDVLLPAEFRQILQSAQITRGDLAALIGVRLDAVLRDAPASQAVMTDARGHWAASWISAVASAGVMEPFENHTFQPRAPLQRVGLATAVSRLIALLSATQPSLGVYLSARPAVADMNPTHLSYPAVSAAVATDVLPLFEGGRFRAARPVSGLEAVEAIERLKALAAGSR